MKTKPLCQRCQKNIAVAFINRQHVCKKCFYILIQKSDPREVLKCANCHRRFKSNQILTPPIFCCEKCRHQFIKNSKIKLQEEIKNGN